MNKRKNSRGNPRRAGLEQYYTLPETARRYAQVMVDRYGTEGLWIEPSGGRGDLIEALLALGVQPSQIDSYDIEPHHPLVQQADFLDTIIWDDSALVFGNPPFGRACNLAIKFFNHCAQRARVIGFIIPPSFNKPSIQDQLNRRFHQVFREVCPTVSFYNAQGQPHTGGLLRTEFQIWERRDTDRALLQNYRSTRFSFVKQGQPCDLAFRTHGNNAGRILEGLDYNPRTTAFIKLADSRARQALAEADYSFYLNSTSHIPCLAPAEISMCVDAWYQEHSQI